MPQNQIDMPTLPTMTGNAPEVDTAADQVAFEPKQFTDLSAFEKRKVRMMRFGSGAVATDS